jgi:hypothetical protein
MDPKSVVQVEGGVHGGVRGLEIGLAFGRRFRLNRLLPADEHLSEPVVIWLDDIASPGDVAQPIAERVPVDELRCYEDGQTGRDPVSQRLRVEPHDPHLGDQVFSRAEGHPQPVGGDQALEVLELQGAQIVVLGLLAGVVARAVVGRGWWR